MVRPAGSVALNGGPKNKRTTMDNFSFDITSDDKADFDAGVEIAFRHNHEATHFYIDKELGFVLCWHQDGSSSYKELPYPVNVEQAKVLLWGYVVGNKPSDHYPDIDGSVSNDAFRIRSVSGGWSYAFVAAQPKWAIYHK